MFQIASRGRQVEEHKRKRRRRPEQIRPTCPFDISPGVRRSLQNRLHLASHPHRKCPDASRPWPAGDKMSRVDGGPCKSPFPLLMACSLWSVGFYPGCASNHKLFHLRYDLSFFSIVICAPQMSDSSIYRL